MYPAIYATAKDWVYVQTAQTVQHVLPPLDLIDHEMSTMCVCSPAMIGIVANDGNVYWSVDHHSMDRREEED